MPEVRVCEASSIPEQGRKVVDVDGVEVGVFKLGGEFYAWLNQCPHLDGPVCQGKILPLALEAVGSDGTSSGRVFSPTEMNVVCPWHGYEFSIRTGEHPTNRRIKMAKVPVTVRDGEVYVTVRTPTQA